jgi:hypothetical protein
VVRVTDAARDDEPTVEAPPEDGAADVEGGAQAADESRDLVTYARYALLAGLTLLALVATFRFYFAVSSAIDIWVAREFRPLFQAAFNLVVLLLAAVGISWEVRKVAG